MLGELVAREIKQIEHENTCKCPGCEVTKTARRVDVFFATHQCDCPVCQTARIELQNLMTKLDKLDDALRQEHDRLDPLIAQEAHNAEQENEIRNLAGLEGGVLYAAKVIRNVIHTYHALIEAAHAAYEAVHTTGAIGGILKTLRQVTEAAPVAHRNPNSDELPN